MEHETLLLSRQDIEACLNMMSCLRIVEEVFKAHGENRVVMPPKLTLRLEDADGWINAMPAYFEPYCAAGLKWAGGWRQNITRGLPYIMATILLIDAQTGLLLSVMEGGLVTDLRTGAATAIAAKYLAREDARIIAIIGAGVQGRMQVRALSCVFSLSEIRVADVIADARTAFVQDMGKELGIPIREAADNEEAVRGADIVITATTSDQVLVRNDWVARGAFVASLGSYPELDPRLILRSDKLVVDSWAQSMHRGELSRLVLEGRITEKDIHAEVGQIIHGSKPARESNDETIVACLIGLGTHDIACAHFVYQEAKKKKLGRPFSFRTFD